MTAYYNENDPYAATWLEILIFAGLIPWGHVDRRSIKEVTPNDVAGFTQVHLFAGIGGWPVGLRLAGWPDDRPVWTGSCPCQPFSAAGKRKGEADERHLWPVMRSLVEKCQPPVVFGEQVASKDGRTWLAGVRTDLEALGYAVGAADLCAAGVGAPHIRQRLWWVAESNRGQRDGLADGEGRQPDRSATGRQQGDREPERGGSPGRMADNNSGGQQRLEDSGLQRQPVHDADGRGAACRLADAGHKPARRPAAPRQEAGGRPFGDVAGRGATGRMADADGGLACDGRLQRGGQHGQQPQDGRSGGMGDADDEGPQGRRVGRHGADQRVVGSASLDGWSTYDIVHCTDGKARRFEPGSFPLAHGVSNRVGRLRAYGNAIVPQVAATFVASYLDLKD